MKVAKKESKKLSIPIEKITGKIYFIRGQNVMLDRDLAGLYDVQTKALKQAVRRNINRFPSDFMFEINQKKFKNLRSQIVTSSWGGVRYKPMAFTEQGAGRCKSAAYVVSIPSFLIISLYTPGH